MNTSTSFPNPLDVFIEMTLKFKDGEDTKAPSALSSLEEERLGSARTLAVK